MRRRNPTLAVAGVALALLVAWLLWPSPPPLKTLPPVAPVARPPRGAGLRSAKGSVLPSASITATAAPKPCVRGRVVNAATNAGVPGAQVVLATSSGALQGQTDREGAFELTVDDSSSVGLAEVSAEGYFPYRPEWGHFPIELTLKAGTCVSDLVLSLVPRMEYRGWVLGPAGQPVAGASVTIATADEPPGPPLLTGPEGGFTFHAQDGAILVARHPKFGPGSAQVDFRVGVTREVVIKLGPKPADAGVDRATLLGLVIDLQDAGMPGAQVKALQTVSAEAEARVEGGTETNPEGRFSLEVEGPGPWMLFAHVPGVLSNPVTTRGEPVVIRLVAGTELRGTVIDGTGRAVQSFSVMISRRVGPLRTEGEDARHVVDAEGRFSIKGLAPGPVRVMVAALGYAPSDAVDVELVPASPVKVDVKLREGAKVAGQVIDRKSRGPLEGARVSLEGQAGSTLTVMPSARTDADGGFVLGGVSPGRRSLFVAAAQHHARLVSVEAREGETTGPLLIDLGPLEKGEAPRLELVGVGAVLEAKGDALVIKEVLPGGGAAEVGLVAGDGIFSIGGEPAAKLGFAGGIDRIRGPEGTSVSLEVRRVDGSVATVVAPRRRIEH